MFIKIMLHSRPRDCQDQFLPVTHSLSEDNRLIIGTEESRSRPKISVFYPGLFKTETIFLRLQGMILKSPLEKNMTGGGL